MRRIPTQKRSRDRVATLLDAAVTEFAEAGYTKATMTAIAARADVPIGSLYQYFPDKEALLFGIADLHLEEGSARMLEALASVRVAEDLEEAVHQLVRAAIEANHGDPRVHRLMFREAPRPAALQERLELLETSLARFIAGELVRRSICEEPTASRRAQIAVIAVEALIHDFALDPPPGTSTAEAQAEIERAALAILRD